MDRIGWCAETEAHLAGELGGEVVNGLLFIVLMACSLDVGSTPEVRYLLDPAEWKILKDTELFYYFVFRFWAYFVS